MIKIENKYAIGQTVYCISKENKCVAFEIISISVLVRKSGIFVSYYEKDTYISKAEEELFASPEELRKHVFEDTIDFT